MLIVSRIKKNIIVKSELLIAPQTKNYNVYKIIVCKNYKFFIWIEYYTKFITRPQFVFLPDFFAKYTWV